LETIRDDPFSNKVCLLSNDMFARWKRNDGPFWSERFADEGAVVLVSPRVPSLFSAAFRAENCWSRELSAAPEKRMNLVMR